MRITKSIEELLFEILEELKKMNNTAIIPSEPTTEDIKLITETKKYSCKYCGGGHDQPWEIAKCGKNKKKEGAK